MRIIWSTELKIEENERERITAVILEHLPTIPEELQGVNLLFNVDSIPIKVIAVENEVIVDKILRTTKFMN